MARRWRWLLCRGVAGPLSSGSRRGCHGRWWRGDRRRGAGRRRCGRGTGSRRGGGPGSAGPGIGRGAFGYRCKAFGKHRCRGSLQRRGSADAGGRWSRLPGLGLK
ncbi:MAG: hypothetical protein EBZ51_02600, partial [Synechococcaceae bacterium WB9_2_112]|nr:hypothetical protein [Synechococcaceae bacterium WB9_2_112]